MSANTGGAAFPGKVAVDGGINGYVDVDAPGMTLRDYFAAKAMAGMPLKWDGAYSAGDRNLGNHLQDARWVAAAAYRYADAMLAARSTEAK